MIAREFQELTLSEYKDMRKEIKTLTTEVKNLTERRDFWKRRATTRQMKINQLTYEMGSDSKNE